MAWVWCIFKPRRACARVTVVVLCVCVCVSVRLSVPALAASAYIYTCNQQYPRVSRRLFLDFDLWIIGKKHPFKRKSQYANKLELTVSRFCAVSGPTKHSSYMKGNWSVECCLRGGAAGVKKAR